MNYQTYCGNISQSLDIGDEFHYLLCCPTFKEKRKNFINLKYYIRPLTFYLHELFDSLNKLRVKTLKNS